ncbi:hypothetical protein [Pseudomonas sp. 460]|uniref:hypothetical protein n=1 Tax=Pseudomonas sp. 460 TaxID=2485142 RepID=UPI00104524A8|nr:hypothetical protein [Pseudomonas sp. 460]TCV51408.1 hypothetical protein EDB99_10774 [Pseudomonas sp. 460]
MADREITPGMTAEAWRDVGYEAGMRGQSHDTGPHDQSEEVFYHWERGYYAAEADRIAEEGE